MAIVLVVAIALGSDTKVHNELRIEIVKSLLELVIVVVVCGVAAALFKAHEYTREVTDKVERNQRERRS